MSWMVLLHAYSNALQRTKDIHVITTLVKYSVHMAERQWCFDERDRIFELNHRWESDGQDPNQPSPRSNKLD